MIRAFNHHRRMVREDWNRTCHSDALREMQFVPAEELQVDPQSKPKISRRFGFTLAAFVAGVIVHHIIWSAAL